MWELPTRKGSGIANYELQRRETTEIDWHTVTSTIEPTATTYTVDKRSWDVGYDYRIRSVYRLLVSHWSNRPRVAGRPSGLRALRATGAKNEVGVRLNWGPPSNDAGSYITGYAVQWRPDATGNWDDNPATGSKTVGMVTSTSITASDGLQPGTAYNFRYRAHNRDRQSYYTPDDGSVAATTIDGANLSIADASAEEGDPVTFTVSLSAEWAVPVTVDYTLSDDSARQPDDYRIPQDSQVTIPMGQTSATFTVNTVEDTLVEHDERFLVDLSAPAGGLPANVTFSRSSAVGTIVNDDTGGGGGGGGDGGGGDGGGGGGDGGGDGGGGGGGPTASSDASLRGLTISAGELAFDSATTRYAVEVEHDVTSVTLTPTASHAAATVAVNGAAVASGSASAAIALEAGENVIEVVVTAEDGTKRTYTVTVTRAALPVPALPVGGAVLLGVLLLWRGALRAHGRGRTQ